MSDNQIPEKLKRLLRAFAPNETSEWRSNFFYRYLKLPLNAAVESDQLFTSKDDVARLLKNLRACQRCIESPNDYPKQSDFAFTSYFTALDKIPNLPHSIKRKLRHNQYRDAVNRCYQKMLALLLLEQMQAAIKRTTDSTDIALSAQDLHQIKEIGLWIKTAVENQKVVDPKLKVHDHPVAEQWAKFKERLANKTKFHLNILWQALKSPFKPNKLFFDGLIDAGLLLVSFYLAVAHIIAQVSTLVCFSLFHLLKKYKTIDLNHVKFTRVVNILSAAVTFLSMLFLHNIISFYVLCGLCVFAGTHIALTANRYFLEENAGWRHFFQAKQKDEVVLQLKPAGCLIASLFMHGDLDYDVLQNKSKEILDACRKYASIHRNIERSSLHRGERRSDSQAQREKLFLDLLKAKTRFQELQDEYCFIRVPTAIDLGCIQAHLNLSENRCQELYMQFLGVAPAVDSSTALGTSRLEVSIPNKTASQIDQQELIKRLILLKQPQEEKWHHHIKVQLGEHEAMNLIALAQEIKNPVAYVYQCEKDSLDQRLVQLSQMDTPPSEGPHPRKNRLR